jgi:hypothetical protein
LVSAVGLSNFVASSGIGQTGVDTKLRLRIASVFGAFATAMPIVEFLIGHGVAHDIGSASAWEAVACSLSEAPTPFCSAMSLAGIELSDRLGTGAERRSHCDRRRSCGHGGRPGSSQLDTREHQPQLDAM